MVPSRWPAHKRKSRALENAPAERSAVGYKAHLERQPKRHRRFARPAVDKERSGRRATASIGRAFGFGVPPELDILAAVPYRRAGELVPRRPAIGLAPFLLRPAS